LFHFTKKKDKKLVLYQHHQKKKKNLVLLCHVDLRSFLNAAVVIEEKKAKPWSLYSPERGRNKRGRKKRLEQNGRGGETL
jgi:hypothetical protein